MSIPGLEFVSPTKEAVQKQIDELAKLMELKCKLKVYKKGQTDAECGLIDMEIDNVAEQIKNLEKLMGRLGGAGLVLPNS